MSFWVSVIRSEDIIKLAAVGDLPTPKETGEDAWSAAFDKWQEEIQKIYLYMDQIGSDGGIYTFWSMIAYELKLPMITSIYKNGLRLATLAELQQFSKELNVLEEYWDTHELHAEPNNGMYGREREALGENMGMLREAIRIAIRENAMLSIS